MSPPENNKSCHRLEVFRADFLLTELFVDAKGFARASAMPRMSSRFWTVLAREATVVGHTWACKIVTRYLCLDFAIWLIAVLIIEQRVTEMRDTSNG